jgi:hypothetical protein
MPILKQSLDLKLLDTEGLEQLSVAVGVAQVALAQVSVELVMLAVILAGQLMRGKIVSFAQGLGGVTTVLSLVTFKR